MSSAGTHRLLLDVSSMMYRAYFAMRDTVFAPDGRPVGALHGYLEMVTRLIATRRPDEVVHVYDHEWRPVARTDIYPAYKGTRPPDPEDLPPQFALLRGVLDLTGMLQAQTEGWEAEDAIGAFCLDAGSDDRLEIVSGDRDLIQLVQDPVVRLLYTVRGVSDLLELDEAGVLTKYGVPASRYAEFAILRGDPSDDLPGVKGVGEKTARALVQAFPSIEAILAGAAEGSADIAPRIRERLLESSSYLDAMLRLVPVNGEAKLSLWAGGRDDAALKELAAELGIKGPSQRLLAAIDAAGAA
ncbi:MAG TPA: 5'-3' exonuclease [Actinomycetota bacterium]|jgi:5'-3' exonuclease